MKVQKKILTTIMITTIIIFCLLTTQNEAANETNTNATTTNNSTVAEKSGNANLSDLGITPHDFKGFKYGTTSYEVVVPESTESVEVYAKTQDSKATVTGTGKKILEKGENKAEVVVTAEDGTKKTYAINIIREIQQDEYEDPEKEPENESKKENEEIGNGLVELKINDLVLSPEFKTNVYEYTAKYIGEDTKLKVEAKPTDDTYEVDITGNDKLQEGENFITILVSEKDGNNVATYQVKVIKSLIDEEAIAKEESKKKTTQQIIIGVAIGIMIMLIGAVVTIIIHKRNIKLEEEYSGRLSFDKEEDDEEEGEVPKALKGKRYQEDTLAEETEEEDYENMPKQELKEKFLNGYTMGMDIDFKEEEEIFKKKRKQKGKRFK